MTKSHHCRNGGYLVADDRWLPSEAIDYYGANFGLFVGCNQLTCTRCGQPVRAAVGYWQAPPVAPALLYAEPRWATSAIAPIVPDATGRLYACACYAAVAHAPTPLAAATTSDEYEELPPWQCAGHPALTPPTRFEGLTLSRPTDWHALASAKLAVSGAVHPSVDTLPGFVLTRIHQALADAADRAGLGAAVGAHARDPAPAIRQGVALFYALNPDAAGLTDVLAAWQAEPALYDDVAAPWGPQPTLRTVLLEAIACRLAAGPEPIALATLRWAATRAPGLDGYLYRLRHVDAAWAIDHVDLLVDAAPADWAKVLRAVRVPDVAQLRAACQRAIDVGPATRERVVAVLAELYGPRAAAAVGL